MKDVSPTDENMVKYFELIEKKGLAEEGWNITIELVETPAGNYAEKNSI